MSTAQKMVPMPYAIALLALILAGGYFGFSSSLKGHATNEAAAKVATK